jgi:CRISPR system Cascade subunit CasE
MSFLTKIQVPYALAIHKLRIRDSYDWHQKAWNAFPGRDGEKRDFLSRIDEQDEAYRLLILSNTAPQKPDWCPTDCFESKEVPEDFFSHPRYRFSLLANPTKKEVKLGVEGKMVRTGKRLALKKPEELVAWIRRKGEAGGFTLEGEPRMIPKPRSYFHNSKSKMNGVHHAVEFQGVLHVTDASLFKTTVHTGIGSAKAFGFGLLALAPLQ